MGENQSITLVPAKKEDAVLLWKWRNDPVMRKNAVNTLEIPFEDHAAWFENALQSKSKKIFLLYCSGAPAGVVRLDVLPDILPAGVAAEISINVAPEHRGRGFGTAALIGVCTKCLGLGFKEVVAKIKEKNIASIKSFANAGFIEFKKEKLITASGAETLIWVKKVLQ